MGESTVITVARLISQTAAAERVIADAENLISSPKELEFKYYMPYKQNEMACSAILRAIHKPDISLGRMSDVDLNSYSSSRLWVSTGEFLKKDLLTDLFDRTFGIHEPGKKKAIVPTYGLTKKKKGDDIIDKLESLLRERIHERLSPLMDKVSLQYTEEARMFFASEECRQGKIKAKDDLIIKGLVEVLVRYKNVTPELIQAAANEAIVTLVSQD